MMEVKKRTRRGKYDNISAVVSKYNLPNNLPENVIRDLVRAFEKVEKHTNSPVTLNSGIVRKVESKSNQLNGNEIFEDLKELTRMVVEGFQPSLLVTGAPGVGKTYVVTEVCESILGKEGEQWVHIKGKISPMGLYAQLFLARNKLIVFDDSDSVFDNEASVNMLKAALDSYEKRTISWNSKNTVSIDGFSEEEKVEFFENLDNDLNTGTSITEVNLPNKFDFNGQVIFISNLHESKIDSAVKSRSFTIDVTLTKTQVIERIESIIKHIEGSTSDKKEVIKYMKERVKNDDNSDISIRTFILSLRCKKASTRWEKLINRYT